MLPTASFALVQLDSRRVFEFYNRTELQQPIARKSLLQSSTCQAGVNSCQVGLLSAPLPCARAAEGGPHTHLRQQITSAETCEDVRPEHSHTPMRGAPLCSLKFIPEPPGGFKPRHGTCCTRDLVAGMATCGARRGSAGRAIPDPSCTMNRPFS